MISSALVAARKLILVLKHFRATVINANTAFNVFTYAGRHPDFKEIFVRYFHACACGRSKVDSSTDTEGLNIVFRGFCLFVGLHFKLKNFKVRRSEKKTITGFESIIQNLRGMIYIDDMYSMKDVNLGPKDHSMCHHFDTNHFKG